MSWQFAQNADEIIVGGVEHVDSIAGDMFVWRKNDPLTPAGSVNGEAVSTGGNSWNWRRSARLTMQFSVATTGDYELYLRCHTNGRDCSVWLIVDDDYTLFGQKNFGRLKYNSGTGGWAWRAGDGNNVVHLAAGSHTLHLIAINRNFFLDRIAFQPVGETTLFDGFTGNGPAESNNTGNAEPITFTETYEDWLLNSDRQNHRVLLAEMTHADGVTRLSNVPWNKKGRWRWHQVYDDSIVGQPYFDDSLDRDSSVGDLEIVHTIEGENLLDHTYTGFGFRWLYGDQDWPYDRFREIATGTIDELQRLDSRRFRFDLVSDARRYDRTFTEIESTEIHPADQAVDWILSHYDASATVRYINIEPTDLDVSLKFSVDANTRILGLLRGVARSLSCELRTTQLGGIEFLRPDTDSSLIFTEDNVVERGLSIVQTIPPYQSISVIYNDGESRTSRLNWGARTGAYDNEIVINTLLEHEADAVLLRDRESVRHTNQRRIWEIHSTISHALAQPGDRVICNHRDLQTSGYVSRIRHRPLSRFTNIEVTV